MNNKLTYIEARDKIWNAYFRGDIKPFDRKFCFCGTLSPDRYWAMADDGEYPYLLKEYAAMEIALLIPLGVREVIGPGLVSGIGITEDSFYWEDTLFTAMLAALEVLKQIHRERGEVIPEDEQPLTKRILQTTNQ